MFTRQNACYDFANTMVFCADSHAVSSSFLAAACSVLSMAWAGVAYTLGRRFDRRLRRPPLPTSTQSLEPQGIVN